MQVKDQYSCVVYGDSISKGIVFDEERQRYVVSHQGFSELLQEEFKGVIHTVGKFGNTTTGAAERLEKLVIEKRPDIVLLEFGGNDCDFNWEEVAQNPFKDHKPKTEIPVFCDLFKRIIQKLRTNQITPVLMTLPPLDAERYFKWVSKNNPLYEQNILQWLETVSKIYWWHERYNAAIIQIAEETDTKWIDVRGTFLTEMDFRGYICRDGIHPNEKGHRLIARKILSYTREKYDFLMNH